MKNYFDTKFRFIGELALHEEKADSPQDALLSLQWSILRKRGVQDIGYLLSLLSLCDVRRSLLERICFYYSRQLDIQSLESFIRLQFIQQVDNDFYSLNESVRNFLKVKLEESGDSEKIKKDFCKAAFRALKETYPNAGDIYPKLSQDIPHVFKIVEGLEEFCNDDTLLFFNLLQIKFCQQEGYYEKCLEITKPLLSELSSCRTENIEALGSYLKEAISASLGELEVAEIKPINLVSSPKPEYYSRIGVIQPSPAEILPRVVISRACSFELEESCQEVNLSSSDFLVKPLETLGAGLGDSWGEGLLVGDKYFESIVPSTLDLAHINLNSGDLEKIDLSSAFLYKSNFAGAKLARSSLSNSLLRQADLRFSDLQAAKLDGANLVLAIGSCGNFEQADLQGANLRASSFINAKLKSAILRGSNLQDACFRLSNLSYADLRNVDLRNADLSGVNLQHADLRGADLTGACLRFADIKYADLRNAKIENVIVQGCNFSQSKGISDDLEKSLQGRGAQFDENFPGCDFLSPPDVEYQIIDFELITWCLKVKALEGYALAKRLESFGLETSDGRIADTYQALKEISILSDKSLSQASSIKKLLYDSFLNQEQLSQELSFVQSQILEIRQYITFLDKALFKLNLLLDEENALALAKNEESRKNAQSFLCEGLRYHSLSQPLNAAYSWELASELYRMVHDGRGELMVLLKLAKTYGVLKEYKKALKYACRSVTLAAEVGDAGFEVKALLQVSWLYLKLGNHNLASKFYRKSVSVFQRLNDQVEILFEDSRLNSVAEKLSLSPVSSSYSSRNPLTSRLEAEGHTVIYGYNSEPNLLKSGLYLDLYSTETGNARITIEEDCFAEILQPGALIRIKAPRQMGKTSLMARILHYAEVNSCEAEVFSVQRAYRQMFRELNQRFWLTSRLERQESLMEIYQQCLKDAWVILDDDLPENVGCQRLLLYVGHGTTDISVVRSKSIFDSELTYFCESYSARSQNFHSTFLDAISSIQPSEKDFAIKKVLKVNENLRLLNENLDVSPDDSLPFYFSGHGSGGNALAELFSRSFSSEPCKLVLLDSCYSGWDANGIDASLGIFAVSFYDALDGRCSVGNTDKFGCNSSEVFDRSRGINSPRKKAKNIALSSPLLKLRYGLILVVDCLEHISQASLRQDIFIPIRSDHTKNLESSISDSHLSSKLRESFDDDDRMRQACVALGFQQTASLAKAAGVHLGTLSHICIGKRILEDDIADKLIRAVKARNKWSYLESANHLAEALNFLQCHHMHLYGKPERELTSIDVKRWHCNYLNERVKVRYGGSEPPEPENLQLSTESLLEKILNYLWNWQTKHDFSHLEKIKQSFQSKYSTLIAPSIRRGMIEEGHYDAIKTIYPEIRCIASLCHKSDFLMKMSMWLIDQAKIIDDAYTEVSAVATYAWELSAQDELSSIDSAQQYVDKIWAISGSKSFQRNIVPEYMDTVALLCELRLRVPIRLAKARDSSFRDINFDQLLAESRGLLKKQENWQALSSRLKIRYEIPLDYQHGIYLYRLGEYHQARLEFESIAEKASAIGWNRVGRSTYSWLITIFEATENYEKLAEVLQKAKVKGIYVPRSKWSFLIKKMDAPRKA